MLCANVSCVYNAVHSSKSTASVHYLLVCKILHVYTCIYSGGKINQSVP